MFDLNCLEPKPESVKEYLCYTTHADTPTRYNCSELFIHSTTLLLSKTCFFWDSLSLFFIIFLLYVLILISVLDFNNWNNNCTGNDRQTLPFLKKSPTHLFRKPLTRHYKKKWKKSLFFLLFWIKFSFFFSRNLVPNSV